MALRYHSVSPPPMEARYATLPARMARTHRRRVLPVLRPMVASPPYPRGGRAVNQSSCEALRTWPPRGWDVNQFRLCPGGCGGRCSAGVARLLVIEASEAHVTYRRNGKFYSSAMPPCQREPPQAEPCSS